MHPQFPKHVWEDLVFSKLSLTDQIRFSAVCRSWRSMAVENQHLINRHPWLLISRDESTNIGTFFSLSESKIYHLKLTPSASNSESFCTGSSQGHLVIADNNTIFLYNPFTQTQITLPIQYASITDPLAYFRKKYYFHKVIVSQAPKGTCHQLLVSAVTCYLDIIEMCRPGDQEWSIFGVNKEEEERRRQLRTEWTSINNISPAVKEEGYLEFSDILFYKGMLYGLTKTNCLVSFEFQDSSKPLSHNISNVLAMTSPTDDKFKFDTSYLVESCGDLLMVYRFANRDKSLKPSRYVTGKFLVYKLDKSDDPLQWVEVESLGDQMLFLGRNSSMSISAKDIPGLKGNCIYFTEDFWPYYHLGGPSVHVFTDNGVFYLDDARFESFLPAGVSEIFSFKSRPFWVTPDIVLKDYLAE